MRILSPVVASTFAGGDTLHFEAFATDAEDGDLPAGQVSWWVELHHDIHTHPFVALRTGNAGFALIPRVGHPESDIFYRVHARAVDSQGLADTITVDIAPRLTSITIATEPAGLQVTVDGQPRMTPAVIASVVGMERVIGAVSPQSSGDATYAFSEWSDDGGATHPIVATTAPTALVATFVAIAGANIAPTVSIAAPAAGATVTEGASVTLAANAGDTDGTVARVRFFVGAVMVGDDIAPPFSVQWTPAGLGARTITAQATDDDGAFTTSAALPVTVQAAGGGDVQAPVATLTAPAAGTRGLVGSVAITANATDDVAVTRVEFEVDGAPFATDDVAPYEASLPSTAAYASGAHVVRARARDAAGNWSPWVSAVVSFGGSVTLPSGFTRVTAAPGFGSLLTSLAFAPDGRIFVTELNGAVRIVKNGLLLAAPFATVPALVEGERGLLGVALDPAFITNGHVYIYYTTATDGAHNRISRFTANGDVAVPGSEVILVELPALSPALRHNGGAMNFGPDGKLYVAVGDDGVSSNAPLTSTPFGKMLRFMADGTIPDDNPFAGSTTGINRAIWAKGLRNPYTFSIQPGTGRMHINDVGQETWEEVNLGRAGADYGWPATEGATADPAYDSPLLAVAHDDSPTLFEANAIVGGAFYNPAIASFGAEYVGDYFFADYVAGWIYRMDVENGNAPYAFAHIGAFITGLGVAPDGALYVLVGTTLQRITR